MNNSDITILSPHQDDAALSLANFIVHYSNLYEFKIINCFTFSNHSPYWPNSSIDDIIQKRCEEDSNFIKQVRTKYISCINLSESDSLLRLKTHDINYIITERPLNAHDFYHLYTLQQKLSQHIDNKMIFIPLGVGNHIDHILTCLAGITLFNNICQFAFYLDVPYWLFTSLKAIQKRTHSIETFINDELDPHILLSQYSFEKRTLAEIYSSQINNHEIDLISMAPYQGEVLLIPKKSNISGVLKLRKIAWMDLNH